MPTRTTPKDFFLHLGATIALYAAFISFINLSFSIINYSIKDSLAGYFSNSSIAWPISMLVILVPVLFVLEWLIKKDITKMADKGEIWIRKWRIYLTLFLTGATIIGDLIALINTFVNGEVTGRFIYKVLIVLIISGVVFTYYILDRGVENIKTNSTRKILSWTGLIISIGMVVWGFFIVGSPFDQRAFRFDEERTHDLSSIQWQIVNYWQQNNKLPTTLSDLSDSISGYSVPKDPETFNDYEYSSSESTNPNRWTFSLCAIFSRASQDLKGRGEYYPSMNVSSTYDLTYPNPMSGLWDHPAGRTCFERNIDPKKYPVIPMKGV